MICSLFHPVIGGAEKQTENLARELIKGGLKVFVLTERIRGLQRVEDLDGLLVYRDIMPLRWRFICGISYLLSTFVFLYRKRDDYDVIHTHILYHHTLSALVISWLFNKKVVVKIACGGQFGELARIRKIIGTRLLSAICNRVDAFIAISRQIEYELGMLGLSPGKIFHIPNFVDLKKFHPVQDGVKMRLRSDLCLPADNKIALFIGRLVPQKTPSCLIEAWAEVSFHYPHSILVLIGEGKLKADLENQICDLNLQGKVLFLPKTSTISSYFQASDIFILHSLSEGLSNSLMEAMACGLPCVATVIGGNTDLIEDGVDGILVRPSSSEELAQAILGILNDEQGARLLGRRAREKIGKCYSSEYVIPRYINLYNALLSRR